MRTLQRLAVPVGNKRLCWLTCTWCIPEIRGSIVVMAGNNGGKGRSTSAWRPFMAGAPSSASNRHDLVLDCQSTLGPIAVFWNPSSSDVARVQKLIAALSQAAVDNPLNVRVKDGLLLPLATTLAERSFSARVNNQRTETGWRSGIDGLTEYAAKELMWRGLTFHIRDSSLTHESTLGAAYFCSVFSSLEPDLLLAAISSAGIEAEVSGVAQIDASNEFCYVAFWRSLILCYMLTNGHTIEAIPDSMLDFGISGDHLANASSADLERPWPRAGYFSEELGLIVLEERLAELNLPPDWQPPRRNRGSTAPTISPARQFLSSLPLRIEKVNKRDNPDLPSAFRLGDSRLEWPDPAQVLDKVEKYCLNTQHPERKWEGFASLGFSGSRDGDALYLSSTFCSALMSGIFKPYDMKVAADGTGEFAIYVMVAGRGGKFRAATTAWNVQRGKPVALSSAFVSGQSKTPRGPIEFSKPYPPPFADTSNTSWDDKYRWARGVAIGYGHRASFDGKQGLGWLWVPHSHRLSREFAAWYRANHGGMIYSRRRYGGRCTLVSLALPITGISSVTAAIRMSQVNLGFIGVRTFAEVEYD